VVGGSFLAAMAIIAAFLKLMAERGAESLQLVAKLPPFSSWRGEQVELSVTALRAGRLQRIWRCGGSRRTVRGGSGSKRSGVSMTEQPCSAPAVARGIREGRDPFHAQCHAGRE
jgi:hypothetical protein